MTGFREAKFQPGQRVRVGHPDDGSEATIIRPHDFGTWWAYDLRMDDGTMWPRCDESELEALVECGCERGCKMCG